MVQAAISRPECRFVAVRPSTRWQRVTAAAVAAAMIRAVLACLTSRRASPSGTSSRAARVRRRRPSATPATQRQISALRFWLRTYRDREGLKSTLSVRTIGYMNNLSYLHRPTAKMFSTVQPASLSLQPNARYCIGTENHASIDKNQSWFYNCTNPFRTARYVYYCTLQELCIHKRVCLNYVSSKTDEWILWNAIAALHSGQKVSYLLSNNQLSRIETFQK